MEGCLCMWLGTVHLRQKSIRAENISHQSYKKEHDLRLVKEIAFSFLSLLMPVRRAMELTIVLRGGLFVCGEARDCRVRMDGIHRDLQEEGFPPRLTSLLE